MFEEKKRVLNIVWNLKIKAKEMSEPKEQASLSRKSSKDEPQSECIDPELDIRSEHFNPLKALYAPEIDIPIQNAQLFNNLAHYESALKRQQAGGSVSSI